MRIHSSKAEGKRGLCVTSSLWPGVKEEVGSVVSLSLSSEEARELADILSSYLADLRMEIANTDQLDYREMLKRREVLIKEILARLSREE